MTHRTSTFWDKRLSAGHAVRWINENVGQLRYAHLLNWREEVKRARRSHRPVAGAAWRLCCCCWRWAMWDGLPDNPHAPTRGASRTITRSGGCHVVRTHGSIFGPPGSEEIRAQTAQEFVHVIGDEQLRTRVGRFTDAYESARFGNRPTTRSGCRSCMKKWNRQRGNKLPVQSSVAAKMGRVLR